MSNKKIITISNAERWSNPESYSETWNPRTELLASLIGANKTVIEFGAGINPISKYLPESNKCMITDFVDKGDIRYAKYDLNADKLIDFGMYDCAVFSGVLEYITDLPKKIEFVSARCQNIVASYSTLDAYPTNREERGWINSYTDCQLIMLFKDAGMSKVRCIPWKQSYTKPNGVKFDIHQHIYKFTNTHNPVKSVAFQRH